MNHLQKNRRTWNCSKKFSSPILRFPDFAGPFYLFTDISDVDLGGSIVKGMESGELSLISIRKLIYVNETTIFMTIKHPFP